MDITERKLAEEVLSAVSQRLMDAQEAERSHLARELHDDISQRLGVLLWRIDLLAKDAPATGVEFQHQLADTRELTMNLVTDVQGLAHRLHPSRLKVLGLGEAAVRLCEEVSEQTGVKVTFHGDAVATSVSQRVALCLFRVLQEALQNAVRHSGAHDVFVTLRCRDQLELTVRDAGEGFDPKATNGSSLGLVSMRERLKAVHGQLAVESTPRHGTVIRACVPLPKDYPHPAVPHGLLRAPSQD
jgi:signal transduction histidine kinase